jgi:protein SCO1/2
MAARVQLSLAAALGIVAIVLAVILVTGGRSAGSDSPALGPSGFAGSLRPRGIPPQDFTLTDQDGHRTSLAQYRGRVVILTFLYTTCRDTCPVTAAQIKGALNELGPRAVPALAVSVDPVNDTPELARQFLLKQTLTGRMRFLLGTKAQLAPVWKDYYVQQQLPGNKPEDQHSAYVILVDATGRQRIGFPAGELTPEALAHDVRALQDERRG